MSHTRQIHLESDAHCRERNYCVWADGRTSKHAIRAVKLKDGETCEELGKAREAACNCKDC